MEIELLEYLAMKTGCLYLSDLKYLKSKSIISIVIRRVPAKIIRYMNGTMLCSI